MKEKTNSNKIASVGLLTAIGASLCCITPLLSLFSGLTGIASSFSFLEPFRPYLILITVLTLGFAWFEKLKPEKTDEIDCACEENQKSSFWQSKKFLALVTLFAIVMTALPYYSQIFYPKNNNKLIGNQNFQIKTFKVSALTCTSCKEPSQKQESFINDFSGIKTNLGNKIITQNNIATAQLTNTTTNENIDKIVDKENLNSNYKVYNRRNSICEENTCKIFFNFN